MLAWCDGSASTELFGENALDFRFHHALHGGQQETQLSLHPHGPRQQFDRTVNAGAGEMQYLAFPAGGDIKAFLQLFGYFGDRSAGLVGGQGMGMLDIDGGHEGWPGWLADKRSGIVRTCGA